MSNGNNNLIERLWQHDAVVFTAGLEIANGRYIQPTGFPDIGAAIYRDAEGRRWCLVESEQSMTNRLEAVAMRSPGVWVDDLKGLPVLAVKDPKNNLLATNLTEPHRIASSYVLEGAIDGNKRLIYIVQEKIGLANGGVNWPLDKRKDLERLVFAADPAALLHGFQFIQWTFVGLRQARLLHARLEAELGEEEPEVHYGMVKVDTIEPEFRGQAREKTNKGQSLAAKSRIVPKRLAASFELDLVGLKSLDLDDDEEERQRRQQFLLGLALWKIGAFLQNRPAFDWRSRSTGPALRLRTDCYLRCTSLSWAPMAAAGEPTDVNPAHLSASPERPDGFKQLLDQLRSNDTTPANENGPDLRYEGPVLWLTYKPRRPKKTEEAPGEPASSGEEESSPEGDNEE
jgi:CRISPR-associated protein Csb1